MSKRAFLSFILFLILLVAALYASPYFINFLNSRYAEKLPQLNFASSTLGFFISNNAVNKIISLPEVKEIQRPLLNQSKEIISPLVTKPKAVVEVSTKSLTELINSSVIQLYCGNFEDNGNLFSQISRGSGVIINSQGIILTNRHIIYDENLKKPKSDCFVLKSPFPNLKSEKPKIYYFAKITNWPAIEKFSKNFSVAQYYNDIAILKISSRPGPDNSKINLILGFDYATADDYKTLELDSKFNYFPIDWDYFPKAGDNIISAGYGTDASRIADKITAVDGVLAGNIKTGSADRLEIFIIQGNATAGFSGGALINPFSRGLIGLISWVSTGQEEGKYTVAIFRDFLGVLMKEEFNIDLRELVNQ